MKIVSLTSKNQLTIPVALLREQSVSPGTKFAARWHGPDLVLTPIRSLRDTVDEANAALAPLVGEPRTDEQLREVLHSWPREPGNRNDEAH